MTYVVERYFHRKGRIYGPYLYLYRTERVDGVRKTVYVGYLGKGTKPREVAVQDIREEVSGGVGDLPDAVRLLDGREFVVFDFETTGFSHEKSGVIQTAAYRCKVENGRLKILDSFNEFSNPGHKIPGHIFKLTRISNRMVKKARKDDEVLKDFRKWIGKRPVVGHNVAFDLRFLEKDIEDEDVIDTMRLSRALYGPDVHHKLPDVANREGIDYRSDELHRADEDVRLTAKAMVSMARKIKRITS